MFEIGPFRLDPQARILCHRGLPLPLGPRAVAVLTTLVEHANEPVPKRRILEDVWPGRVIEEGNLAVQVSAIRRTLALAPGGERWVQTLPRRGYCFVGPLRRDVARAREISELRRLLIDLDPRELATLLGPRALARLLARAARIAHEEAHAPAGEVEATGPGGKMPVFPHRLPP